MVGHHFAEKVKIIVKAMILPVVMGVRVGP